jgi:hypothetical protein
MAHHGGWAPRIIKGNLLHSQLGSDFSPLLIIGRCILSPFDIWKVIFSPLYAYDAI